MRKYSKSLYFLLIIVMVIMALTLVACRTDKPKGPNKQYEITLFIDGAESNIIYDGKALNLPAYPEKEGYTFLGWVLEDGTSFNIDEYINNPTNITIFAKFKENHIHKLVKVYGQEPTCTENGAKEYYQCECGAVFEDKEGKIAIDNIDQWKVIPAFGHDYSISYTWSEDNTQCTVQRVCKIDSSHRDEVTVETTMVRTEPTCTEDGNTEYTADFSQTEWAENQVKNVALAKLGHNYLVSYNWNDDKTQCTAVRVCQNDNSHKDEITVDTTNRRTAEPTCTEDGNTEYTADFSQTEWAETQVENVAIAKLGHNYGEFINKVLPTCETDGVLGHYHCDRCNKDFDANKNELTDLTITKLGHNYVVTYTWNTEKTQCTALRVCQNDSSHRDEVTIETTIVRTEPTCTENGNIEYTADFSQTEWAENQVENVAIEPLGHNYKITYSWNENNKKCTALRVCQNDNSHRDEITVDVTIEKVLPTCTEDGHNTYMAFFIDSTWAKSQLKEEVVPKLGHKYRVNYDSVNHWQECNICGDKQNIEPHNFDSVTHKCACGAYQTNSFTDGLEFEAYTESGIDGYAVTIYAGTNPIVAIPETYNGKPVVKINAYAFYHGFYGHTDIQISEVFIPDSVIIIEGNAFWDTKLSTVRLPKNLKSLGGFNGCENITEIFIPKSVETIRQGAFSGCKNLTRVDFEKGSQLNEIDSDAFLGCSKLTNITIPETVTGLWSGAFEECSSLTQITIPKGVDVISLHTFRNCFALENVEILGQIKTIYSEAFLGCSALKNIVIPETVKTIQEKAFEGCESLVIYTPLSESPKYTERPDLPEKVEGWHYHVGNFPTVWNFEGEYGIEANGFKWAIANGGTVTICGYIGEEKSIVVPNYIYGKTVEHIGKLAFKNCRWITDITLPDTLREIENCAFKNCISLLSVFIPRRVMTIEQHIFSGYPNDSFLRVYCENGYEPTYWEWGWQGISENLYSIEWGCHTIDTVNTYRFDAQNGSEVKVVTSETVINWSKFEKPTKKGYVFMGWCETADCTGKVIAPHYYQDGETTLYAKWFTPEEYKAWCDGSSFVKARNIDTATKEAVFIPEYGKNVCFIFVPTETRKYTFHTLGNNSADNYGTLYDKHKNRIIGFGCAENTNDFSGTYDLVAGEIYYISIGMSKQNYSGNFDFEIK